MSSPRPYATRRGSLKLTYPTLGSLNQASLALSSDGATPILAPGETLRRLIMYWTLQWNFTTGDDPSRNKDLYPYVALGFTVGNPPGSPPAILDDISSDELLTVQQAGIRSVDTDRFSPQDPGVGKITYSANRRPPAGQSGHLWFCWQGYGGGNAWFAGGVWIAIIETAAA